MGVHNKAGGFPGFLDFYAGTSQSPENEFKVRKKTNSFD